MKDALTKLTQFPRTVSRKSKLGALTPEQRQALIDWLVNETVTYQEARKRLTEQFGITVAGSTLSEFWHRHCVPTPPDDNIILDVVIQSSAPVHVVVKRQGAGINLKTA